MPLDPSNLATGLPALGADIRQFYNLLTGSMVDQPVTLKNVLTLTRNVAAAPSERTYLRVTGVADTAVGAEAIDVSVNLARTLQFAAASAPATQRAVYITAPTYSATGGATITHAATVAISGAPIAGTNITLTNTFALKIEGGGMYVAGGPIVLGGSAIATNATSGFLHIPSCAGTPTGTPAAVTGSAAVPLVYDSTNRVLYAYAGGVWTAVSGSGGFVQLDSELVTVAAANIDFSSISAGYSTLLLVIYARGTAASASRGVELRANNDSGANYDRENVQGNDTTASAGVAVAATNVTIGEMPGASATASRFAALRVEIPNYARTTGMKTFLCQAGHMEGTAAADAKVRVSMGHWRSTAAINRITLTPQTGNFEVGTYVVLYGMV